MTDAPAPIQNVDLLGDIDKVAGVHLLAACMAALDDECALLLHRERSAKSRGQAIDAANLRKAALLASAEAMLSALKIQGHNDAASGQEINFILRKALVAARSAFKTIDRGAA